MIEIIAKMAKSRAAKTMDEFDKINVQIEAQPNNIVELSKIKETMEAAPNDIIKLSAEIQATTKIYEILDKFQKNLD